MARRAQEEQEEVARTARDATAARLLEEQAHAAEALAEGQDGHDEKPMWVVRAEERARMLRREGGQAQ
eukprot:9028983-Heterocapsa_arctica.AAC.1